MSDKPLSVDSPVKIGLVVVFLGLTATALGGAIWWAATVSTKLDSVLLQFKALNDADRAVLSQVDTLKERVREIELIGSPKAKALEDRVSALEKALTLRP
jgi:hypothetical protein